MTRANDLKKQFISLTVASGDFTEKGAAGRKDPIFRQSLMNFTIPMIEPMKQLIWKIKFLPISIGTTSETFTGASTRSETEVRMNVNAVTGRMLGKKFIPASNGSRGSTSKSRNVGNSNYPVVKQEIHTQGKMLVISINSNDNISNTIQCILISM